MKSPNQNIRSRVQKLSSPKLSERLRVPGYKSGNEDSSCSNSDSWSAEIVNDCKLRDFTDSLEEKNEILVECKTGDRPLRLSQNDKLKVSGTSGSHTCVLMTDVSTQSEEKRSATSEATPHISIEEYEILA